MPDETRHEERKMTSPAARTLAQPCQHTPGRGAVQLRRRGAVSQAAHAGAHIRRGSDGTGRHGDAPRRVSACTGRAARQHGCTPPSDGVLAGASRRPQAEVELGGKRPLTRSHVALRAASDARGSRRCSVASREHASSFLPLVTGALIISLIGAPDWLVAGLRQPQASPRSAETLPKLSHTM